MLPPALRSNLYRTCKTELKLRRTGSLGTAQGQEVWSRVMELTREAIHWLHLALGPELKPDVVARRVVELTRHAIGKNPQIVNKHSTLECTIHECAVQAVEEANGITKAGKYSIAEEQFLRMKKEREDGTWT